MNYILSEIIFNAIVIGRHFESNIDVHDRSHEGRWDMKKRRKVRKKERNRNKEKEEKRKKEKERKKERNDDLPSMCKSKQFLLS
jgi:outer membrane receptor for ferrienterochelin and colicin